LTVEIDGGDHVVPAVDDVDRSLAWRRD